MADNPDASYKGCPAPTWSTCSSEPVLLARSAAVVAARLASLEPSVAKRILVGKMLIWCPPHSTLVLRLHDAIGRASVHCRPRGYNICTWPWAEIYRGLDMNFREKLTGDVRRTHLLGTWVNKDKKKAGIPHSSP
jgi:hypothetical protein